MAHTTLYARSFIDHPVAPTNLFGRRFADFRQWREELAGIIGEYQSWVETQGLGNSEDDLKIYELIDTLKADKLVIALVAEFSRGKTELVNAIFFPDYKQRLLPSEAGRTTMCPSELRYDPHEPPAIKLLPIATRRSPLTIAEHKRAPTHWTVVPLDVTSPRQMTDAFRHIAKIRRVNIHEAEALGLYDRESETNAAPYADGTVEIPMWRHAIINFPHPLLKQGLVVLDTPGLNSPGTEPELTLGMLPGAHAVLFVLAADAGVTRSDLDIWNHHVNISGGATTSGRLVALNKIDALWDDLHTDDAITATIERQTRETARVLGVPASAVFPVSARKGLLAKIKLDGAALLKSGLPALEQKLANDIIGAKQTLLREKIARDGGAIIDRTRAMIEARLGHVNRQLTELRSLSGKNQDVIHALLGRISEEKRKYDRTLEDFQAMRVALSEQTRVLLDYTEVDGFDRMVQTARTEMSESWTTYGIQGAMKTLFDGALDSMQKSERHAAGILKLVQAIYHRFHTEHALARVQPEPFALARYRDQLQGLRDEAETFRKSPLMIITERHFVVKKFFITLAARARLVYVECHAGALAWGKAIMAPMLTQAREHKIMMEQRLDNLKTVHANMDNLSDRIRELEGAKQNLENQLVMIRHMLRKLEQPLH